MKKYTILALVVIALALLARSRIPDRKVEIETSRPLQAIVKPVPKAADGSERVHLTYSLDTSIVNPKQSQSR